MLTRSIAVSALVVRCLSIVQRGFIRGFFFANLKTGRTNLEAIRTARFVCSTVMHGQGSESILPGKAE